MSCSPQGRTVVRGTLVAALAGAPSAAVALQASALRSADQSVLRDYAGAYQWGPDGFLYVQLWSELAGTKQLVAFDESRQVRTRPFRHRQRVAGETDTRIRRALVQPRTGATPMPSASNIFA